MNYKLIVLMMLVVGVLIAGCAQSGPPSGYATYSGGQEQQQYVGGGCGVAASEPMDAALVSDVSVASAA
jgi:hypothetical protein